MNNDLEKRLKEIKIENIVFFILIVLILMGYYANEKEIDYFINNNEYSKKIYYNTMIIIFLVVVIISGYYSYQSYIEVSNQRRIYSKKYEYTNLNFIANTLALLSALIYLYIAITDTNIEAEIFLS